MTQRNSKIVFSTSIFISAVQTINESERQVLWFSEKIVITMLEQNLRCWLKWFHESQPFKSWRGVTSNKVKEYSLTLFSVGNTGFNWSMWGHWFWSRSVQEICLTENNYCKPRLSLKPSHSQVEDNRRENILMLCCNKTIC